MSAAGLARVFAAVAALGCLAGCAGQPAPRPDRPAPLILPEGYAEPSIPPSAASSPAPNPDPDPCGARRSLNPARLRLGPDGRPAGPALDRVRNPEHGLVVGVSQTARQFSHRDLVTGTLVGFEVEIAQRIGRELFGAESDPRLRLVTMPTGSRLFSLDTEKNRAARKARPELAEVQTVDLAIADVSVTCPRVETYGLRFSAPYLATNSGLMVRAGTRGVGRPEDLAGRKVCSGSGTTNSEDMINLAGAQRQSGKPSLVPVAVADTSECLMLLQRGQIDAIYTDVLILQGFLLQDPGTVLLDYRASRAAVSAIAMSGDPGDDDLVRFVNGVLARMRADGSLAASYGKWFGAVPGLLPLPAVGYSD